MMQNKDMIGILLGTVMDWGTKAGVLEKLYRI